MEMPVGMQSVENRAVYQYVNDRHGHKGELYPVVDKKRYRGGGDAGQRHYHRVTTARRLLHLKHAESGYDGYHDRERESVHEHRAGDHDRRDNKSCYNSVFHFQIPPKRLCLCSKSRRAALKSSSVKSGQRMSENHSSE